MRSSKVNQTANQLELFPFILDQESICNYVQYKKDLNEWKDMYQQFVDEGTLPDRRSG